MVLLPTADTNPKRKRGSGLCIPRLRFGLVLSSAAKSIGTYGDYPAEAGWLTLEL